MSARLRFSRQAAQRGSAASTGTSQLQPIASALTQRRQASSGRDFGATAPSSRASSAVSSIAPGMKPSGAPQRRQAACSNCSSWPQVSQTESFIAGPGGQVRAARGPKNSQAMKPTSGSSRMAITQITFLPVVAFEPITEISAQMSSASRMNPPMPVSSPHVRPPFRRRADRAPGFVVRPGRARGTCARPAPGRCRRGRELLGHRAGELLDVGDRHRPAVVAGDVVADADGDQLDQPPPLDHRDHVAQVLLEIVGRVDRQRRVVDRRAVGDHHQDAPRLGPPGQPAVRPFQRLAVDVLLEQPLLHHQPEVRPRPPPRRVGGLVDDVAQVVQPAGQRRAVRGEPGLAALPALPGPGGEAEDLDLDLAALERAGQHVGRDRRDRDRPAAHRARSCRAGASRRCRGSRCRARA